MSDEDYQLEILKNKLQRDFWMAYMGMNKPLKWWEWVFGPIITVLIVLSPAILILAAAVVYIQIK